jgi:hypothetical protein
MQNIYTLCKSHSVKIFLNQGNCVLTLPCCGRAMEHLLHNCTLLCISPNQIILYGKNLYYGFFPDLKIEQKNLRPAFCRKRSNLVLPQVWWSSDALRVGSRQNTQTRTMDEKKSKKAFSTKNDVVPHSNFFSRTTKNNIVFVWGTTLFFIVLHRSSSFQNGGKHFLFLLQDFIINEKSTHYYPSYHLGC